MIYYIAINLIYLYALFLGKLAKTKLPIVFVFGVLIFFSGLRYDAGNDFFSYLELALGVKEIIGLEPMPQALIYISIWLDDPVIFFIGSSFIYISSIFLGLSTLREANFLTLAFFIFFVLSYLTSFGYVRQYMAIGLAFYSLALLYRNRYILSGGFVCLAILSHYSAVIVLFVFFFRPLFLKLHNPVLYLVSILLAYFSFDYFIFKLASITGLYTEYVGANGSFGVKLYFLLLACFFYVYGYYYLFRVRNELLLVFSMNCAFFCILLYSALLSYGEYLVRISYYFVPFFYVMFSRLYVVAPHKIFQGVAATILLGFSFYATLYYASVNSNRDFLTNISFYPFGYGG